MPINQKKMRMLLKASASKMANFSSCFSLFLVLTRKLLSLSLNFTLDINPLHFIVHVSVSQNYPGYFLWHSILTKLSMLNICAKFFQINNNYGLFFLHVQPCKYMVKINRIPIYGQTMLYNYMVKLYNKYMVKFGHYEVKMHMIIIIIIYSIQKNISAKCAGSN